MTSANLSSFRLLDALSLQGSFLMPYMFDIPARPTNLLNLILAKLLVNIVSNHIFSVD
ncbi:hypothetical protein PICMEDRAFT_71796 [Pichia membranifaciens NRRL Y-2026]|uniref:Uncharacterized protein n=1 Tax=Pichia membranifaciens NRRL Y-2026 TaxID=763406 RepID=A0A1E3NNU6_9ASCO|nr:hypothetical protein PICMEDRAFT_71796 [Pichia membranifaciens NRRL Y-2026]ODQ47764.1 hypothetical protein PICMEDRAFT_71796 [Pichia membranifaciens NRRL Y-2026]